MGLLGGLTLEQMSRLSDDELNELEALLSAKERDENFSKAKGNFLNFSKYINPDFHFHGFHGVYYKILGMFAEGKIKRLIISVPPQMGKSSASTKMLPAYLFGHNPNMKIAIVSYSGDLAKEFNRDIQKVIDSEEYHKLFPETILASSTFSDNSVKGYERTATKFEIVNKKGSLVAIGRGGGLTGKSVDTVIIDDLYKNFEEANSPITREEAINLYKTVIGSRRPKQELIVFTRWHEEDLIGWLEDNHTVINADCWDDFDNIPNKAWIKINFEGLKETPPTEIDPRKTGEALVPELLDVEDYLEKRKEDVENFNCLYQGNPISKEGLMYSTFKTYKHLPELREIKNATDTADTGKDFLCSITYALPLAWDDNQIYILDVIYTQAPMEITEPMVINMLNKWRVSEADIESNNGGRGFARTIQKGVRTVVNSYPQRSNKESRIYSNRAKVNRDIVFPDDWATRWPEFYAHVTRFKKKFKANKTDDGVDCITMVIERSEEGFRVEDIEIDND